MIVPTVKNTIDKEIFDNSNIPSVILKAFVNEIAEKNRYPNSTGNTVLRIILKSILNREFLDWMTITNVSVNNKTAVIMNRGSVTGSIIELENRSGIMSTDTPTKK